MWLVVWWVVGYGSFAKPFKQFTNHPEAKQGRDSRFSAKFSHVHGTELVGPGCPMLNELLTVEYSLANHGSLNFITFSSIRPVI